MNDTWKQFGWYYHVLPIKDSEMSHLNNWTSPCEWGNSLQQPFDQVMFRITAMGHLAIPLGNGETLTATNTA